MQFYDWQSRCLAAWLDNGCRGTINVVTGAGKTVFALAAIRLLREAVSPKQLKVKIVVPQTFLLHQWVGEVREHLEVDPRELGVFYGVHKDTPDRDLMIYVVNSARYTLARHVLDDLQQGYGVLLIADECHRYTGKENARIFDFTQKISLSDANFYSLGLSATPRPEVNPKLDASLGKVIFRYDIAEATRDRVISNCIISNIALNFTRMEYMEYSDLTEKLNICMDILLRQCPELRRLHDEAFFPRVRALSASDSPAAEMANIVLGLISNRRELVYHAEQRLSCVLTLIPMLEAEAKIILFCERIDTAELLYEKLKEIIPNQAGIYHSKMDRFIRRQVLERFKTSTLRVLICCRALDEGLNVPDADVGIVVSSTQSTRQRIQRLGRILRRSSEVKRLYYLYIQQSNEEESLLDQKRFSEQTPFFTMQFCDGGFSSPHFTLLRNRVLKRIAAQRSAPSLLRTLQQNMDLGFARCDWQRDASDCQRRVEQASSAKERNYWMALLYLALEQENALRFAATT